ncbi:MAG: Gfo/Idh/MocA family oxidoreductase [Acidobacteriia bacterium]|nr:Gfo/Idh/MocA family oxidoreductase [Terriglobia bacterium]
MRSSKGMRIAVVGLGFMGGVHLRAWRKMPGVEVAIVSRREHAGTGNLPGEPLDLSGIERYPDIDSALADPRVEAVDLCLPTPLHEEAAIRALRAGKHVLVEKPMAPTVAACERMIEEAKRAGRVLMVGHVLRFFPAYRALMDRDFGEPCLATFRRRCERPEWMKWETGGAVLDLLIHDFDMVLALFGWPCEIEASGSGDLIKARLGYDGFAVEVVGGWHPGKFPITMKYRVVGSRATMEYSFNDEPPPSRDPFAEEIAYFAECVRTGREPERCRPEASAEAVRLALAVIEARKRGAWKSA